MTGILRAAHATRRSYAALPALLWRLSAATVTLPFVVSPGIAAEPALPLDPPRQAQAPEPLCFCWNDGRKIAEGSSSCIRTTQGRRIAYCGRVTNLMSWQITGAPCPES